MSILKFLEFELLVGLGVVGVSYGAFSLLLWYLDREAARRTRERERPTATSDRTAGRP